MKEYMVKTFLPNTADTQENYIELRNTENYIRLWNSQIHAKVIQNLDAYYANAGTAKRELKTACPASVNPCASFQLLL